MRAMPSVELLGPFDVPGLAPRLVRVLRPSRSSARPAPIVVLFDAQNLFDDGPSFAGGWHLHTLNDGLATTRRPAPIVIGIDHGGVDRIHELCPYPGRNTRGQLDRLLDWLTGSLLPRLRGPFDLRAPARQRIIGGSSLGGLAALYAHHRHPELFGGVLGLSPSLWAGGERLTEWIARVPRPAVSRIYLDIGRHEGAGMREATKRMVQLLAAKGYSRLTLRHREDPRGFHRERDWRRRAPSALRFLLNDRSG